MLELDSKLQVGIRESTHGISSGYTRWSQITAQNQWWCEKKNYKASFGTSETSQEGWPSGKLALRKADSQKGFLTGTEASSSCVFLFPSVFAWRNKESERIQGPKRTSSKIASSFPFNWLKTEGPLGSVHKSTRPTGCGGNRSQVPLSLPIGMSSLTLCSTSVWHTPVSLAQLAWRASPFTCACKNLLGANYLHKIPSMI